jgi:ribonuclease BN (tRNA processing enzyme)
MDPADLDGIFVTHRHPDHFLDLFAMQALLRYAPEGPAGPVDLYTPDKLLDLMVCILDERGRADMLASFSNTRLAAGEVVRVGDIEVTPVCVDHVADTYALRVRNADGLLCYTSDSRFGQRVLDAASGADVVLAEATLPREYAGKAPHMTAGEAGELASRAGARRLVLTHLWPTIDHAKAVEEARATFSGEVLAASEMLQVSIP